MGNSKSKSSNEDAPLTTSQQFEKTILTAKTNTDNASNTNLDAIIGNKDMSDYDKVTSLNTSTYAIKNMVSDSFLNLTGVDILTTCKNELNAVTLATNEITESSNRIINSKVKEIESVQIRHSNLKQELANQLSMLDSLDIFVDNAKKNYAVSIQRINTDGSAQKSAMKVIFENQVSNILSANQRLIDERRIIILDLQGKLSGMIKSFTVFSTSYSRRISLLNEKYQADIAAIHISDYKNLYGIVESENIGFQKTKDAIINKYAVYDVQSKSMTATISTLRYLNKILICFYIIAVIYVIYYLVMTNDIIAISGMFGIFLRIFISACLVVYPFVMPYIEWIVLNSLLFIQSYIYNEVFIESDYNGGFPY